MAIIFILPLIFLLSAVFFFTFSSSNDPKLPPGPPPLPLIGNLLYLSRNFTLQDIFPLLRNLRPHYGPIITLRIGTIPTIFILDSSLAHKALIEQSTAFANRPTPNPATSFLSGNNLCITSAQYGHTWRLLRRNLTSEILHPSSIGHFSHGRSWVIGIIERDLVSQIHAGNGIVEPMKCFHFAMFCLLVLMCFGEKLDESLIKEIETVQRNFLISTKTLDILALFPWIPKFWFRKRLGEASAQREKQMQIFTPLINARKEKSSFLLYAKLHLFCMCYFDRLCIRVQSSLHSRPIVSAFVFDRLFLRVRSPQQQSLSGLIVSTSVHLMCDRLCVC